MASIFDQYESRQKLQENDHSHQPHAIQNGADPSQYPAAVATALFRNMTLEDDSPIFSKQRINFQPNFDIIHVAVNNNRLVLAMTNNVLIRINLLHPQDLEEIDIGKYCTQNGRAKKLFLDASGQHLIISLCSRSVSSNATSSETFDTLYIPWNTKKVHIISKLKGSHVSAIAWSQRNTSDILTGPIVCGTTKGVVFEFELSADESMFQSGSTTYCQQLVELEKREEITGVEILPCPTDDLKYVVLCSTKSRLYSFRERIHSTETRPLLQDVFTSYKGHLDNYIEYWGTCGTSTLKLRYEPNTMLASSFAWMNTQGILCGTFNWSKTGTHITDEIKLLKVTRDSGSSKLLSHECAGLVLTPYHLLVPHDSEVTVVCILSEQVLLNDRIPADCGTAVGICQDCVKGTIWMFSSKTIFKCKMDREDRNVWKTYLDQKMFAEAKKYCGGDQLKLLQVRMKEAEHHFQKGEYVESAKLFAHTIVPFEQVFFKLNSVDDDTGLCIYLKEKLNTLSENEKGQFSLVTLIMLEYYFKRLGLLRDGTNEERIEYNQLNKEFEDFLKKPRVLRTLEMNSNAVYRLLSSHADQCNIVKISRLIKAYDRVMGHLINTNRHMEALEILQEHSTESLIMEHLPTLIKTIPIPTVDFMISKSNKLDPQKLIPILVQVHTFKSCSWEIKRYLEYCIDELERTDTALHNFLITLYATKYPNKLLPYLKLQGDNIESVCYDTKLALRECLAVKQDAAAVHILTVMGLYQKAVDLALKTDIGLAKATAERQKNDPQMCKKLWLIITKYLVEKNQNVEEALSIMNECELIKVEDILPFFPEFVTIDLFKDAICESLRKYNGEIEQLKSEMDEASSIADQMRADIHRLKQEHTTVTSEDACHVCESLLLERPFYLFQCSHRFHQDCLCEAVQEYLSGPERQQVQRLRSKLLSLSADDGRLIKDIREKRQQVKEQLDDLIACECLYCGDRIVEAIDKPFIPDEDWQRVMDEWN